MVRYHNIFYYYRGAVLDDGRHRERQLENNTTKALINTLDHCDDRLAQSFLSWLGIPTQETAKFALQRKTIGEPKLRRVVPERRLLLGLTPDPSRDRAASSPEASAQGDSLPDAWYTVPLESERLNTDCLLPGKDGEIISRKGTVFDREEFQGMLDEFYELRGWDRDTGLQKKTQLEALQLDDVIQDLAARGLLS